MRISFASSALLDKGVRRWVEEVDHVQFGQKSQSKET